MATKTLDNTQFGRVSNAAGDSPIGAGAANDGLAPLLDSHGRLITVPYSGGGIASTPPTLVDSAAVVTWQLISATAKILKQAWGSQNSGGLLWVQMFNLAAGPPGAATPVIAPIPVDSPGAWSLSFPEGLSFTTGIVIGYSTTHTTYTLPTIGGWVSALIR